MTTPICRITIHMVSSLDGFIAKKDNSVSWFETSDYYEKGIVLSEEEQQAFLKNIDCYVMGSRTYEHALALSENYGWAYGDLPTIVLTKRQLPVNRPNIELYAGNLEQLITDRLKPAFQNIWVVGGAGVVKDFIGRKLADEIRLSVLPVILGDGLPFFDQVGRELPLHLKDAIAYKNGVVDLWYEIKNNE